MEKKPDIQQFKGQYRLPKFAIPKRYDLVLKPDLSACTFSGSVQVDLSISQVTHFLVLNALDLQIHQASFTNSQNKKYCPCDVVLEADDEVLVLVFDEALPTGDGVLWISFSGVLNDHLVGFYRGTYVDGGVKKNMAATQFEPADARMCFPCWDEPALKATFKVTVEVPSELTALSNMPAIQETVNGHLKTVYFEESSTMSTYLVAVVVGLFDHIEDTTADGIKVRAYCPVGKADQGKFALDVAVKTLDMFTGYFSMPYPLPKMDMVAVPDFSGGAMENYGLIIFREIELLYNEMHSGAYRKQRLTIVVSHEVAHQWFGNLVTMEWWTHLWLNEGFATWISNLATDWLFPEWKIWTQFVQETTGGLRLDALEQSHPIEVEVHHARSVLEIFDAISYEKGSSVIRMLQSYLGDDVFQRSMSTYMKRYAGKNAKTDDLWSVLSEESGIQVNSMMDTWTKQKGYPLISVKSKDNILELEQSQFLSSGSFGDGQWIVPISLCLGSYNTNKNFLLEGQVRTVDISELLYSSDSNLSSSKGNDQGKCKEHSWVKVNVEQTGFYRVKYDDKLAAQLRNAIEENCLSETDKFGVLDDTFALCEACQLSLSSLLSLMDAYRKEFDYILISRLIDVCYNVAHISSDAIPNSVNELKQFFINLLLFSAEKLGWEPVSGERHLNTMLRKEVLMALATFGHSETHKEAMRRFQAFLDDRNSPLLSADTKRAAYIAVMRNTSSTNRTGYESLLKVYRESDGVQEKEPILRSLASCSDPSIVFEVLNLLLSDEIRDQDSLYVLSGISLEAHETAWSWLKENWDLISNKSGSGMQLTWYIKNIVSRLSTQEEADEVEAFFASRMKPTFAMTLKQNIEKIRIKARWVESIKQEQSLPELIKGLACRV
ncbi:hypothetical protein VitviT2T_013220 [Vitis vinifera]|uniref:Aminopeptidase n=1 Tax=Vitis vinifera TaxID=29760 RepID=A0ABY9CH57_VITVI|nr:aminopeptidase M1 isoform X1 [Vitis vinifera]WJZ94349.1 hypothetical protein VitviT2T_013220 [Vitis vinifera]|eukprot:XP_010654509.1 PREDICTED: aminopeptidase M1 isoform X1 [Vitis vinifera]